MLCFADAPLFTALLTTISLSDFTRGTIASSEGSSLANLLGTDPVVQARFVWWKIGSWDALVSASQ